MRRRLNIMVKGVVQGVGFRPFVYGLAKSHNLGGWVCNTTDGVMIEVEGDHNALEEFLNALRFELPPLAVVWDLNVKGVEPTGDKDFLIRHSRTDSEARTTVPPDVAMCRQCQEDISTPGNRRFRYPFTNCTNCGPRFTIIERIPYDRHNTTMRTFDMCTQCKAEYDDPLDRRFHAQPNACEKCGPHLTLDGKIYETDWETISKTARLLWEGKIVAVKGLGGFHLACDARNSEAVARLRERKGRAAKPFALMCSNIDEVRRICETDQASERLLESFERPIVILRARQDSGISPLVAPGSENLGVMIPYTPLHHLLLTESPSALVMTSGNLSEEPIAYQDEEAVERLGRIADHILGHNRPIHMACDDSVARTFDGSPMLLRRARGYVPMPIDIREEVPQILACGGDLKSTFCLTKGRQALLSQHLGDLDNVPTMDHYRRVVEHFCHFFEVKPEVIAHDLHHDYHSTRFAQAFDCETKIGIQHHHAHVVSCMVENQVTGPVIGVSFDGTGYGTDGRLWGGEFIIAEYGEFQRVAHLAYVPMPGGESAIKRPRRMAESYLIQTFGEEQGEKMSIDLMPGYQEEEAYAVCVQCERRFNSPLTSSMGRLFDAVSALLNVCSEVTYEGQAAIELEMLAGVPAPETYRFCLCESGIIDVRPMFEQIVWDLRNDIPIKLISGKFHATMASIVVDVCLELRKQTGLAEVALSGGVFQNMVLLRLVSDGLKEHGFRVLRHRLVPPNDGGLALGQAVIAARRLA